MSQAICHIHAGKITNPSTIRKQFDGLKDGTYLVKVAPRKVRSLQQNAYYWEVVCDMVMEGLRDAGYDEVQTPDDAHEVMKAKFLKRYIVNHQTGEMIEKDGSTASLTTIEFSEYIDRVLQWAAEYLGIVIPLPNENL